MHLYFFISDSVLSIGVEYIKMIYSIVLRIRSLQLSVVIPKHIAFFITMFKPVFCY